MDRACKQLNKISSIGHGVVPSASKKKRGSHINPDSANKCIISQPNLDVKQKFPLTDPFNHDFKNKSEKW